MSAQSIVIVCGAEGLSAEADERVRRMAAQDDFSIRVVRVTPAEDWSRCILGAAEDCDFMVISPDVSQPATEGNREYLYRALSQVSQQGVLLAEVHEDNIFKTDNEVTPLQPSGCHIRLVCGLGAAGYLLAIESLIRAEGLQ